jgi:serine/threonine-protein kinase
MTTANASSFLGQVIGEYWTVEALLGAGSMGEVYRARGKRGERVALKFLRPELTKDKTYVARFAREGNLARAVVSPHVARLLSSGKERTGHLWLAFQFIEGHLLDKILQQRTLTTLELRRTVDQLLLGLESVHAAGVVHRDVKPANVIVNEAGDVHLLDFGIARVHHAYPQSREEGLSLGTMGSLTNTDELVGTLPYMAPEQIEDPTKVDGRADLYSVGILIFRATTGQLPFRAKDLVPLLEEKELAEPLRLSELGFTKGPVDLEHYIGQLVARDPADRFHSARAARVAWKSLAATW